MAMDSKILSQALVTIPRNHKQCLPKTIGFCNFVAGRSFVSSSCCRVSFSSVSVSSIGYNLGHSYGLPRNCDFVTKAESNSEVEVEVEIGEASVSVVEANSELEDAKIPRKSRVKLGDVMGILNKRAVDASEKERPIPDIRTGDIVEIKLEIPENRRRLSIYKGIVISRQNAGIHTTIRIRRIIAGVGVEIVFPLYSPNIKELKVVKHRKVRRARLYYLRDKLPRLSTFK